MNFLIVHNGMFVLFHKINKLYIRICIKLCKTHTHANVNKNILQVGYQNSLPRTLVKSDRKYGNYMVHTYVAHKDPKKSPLSNSSVRLSFQFCSYVRAYYFYTYNEHVSQSGHQYTLTVPNNTS